MNAPCNDGNKSNQAPGETPNRRVLNEVVAARARKKEALANWMAGRGYGQQQPPKK